MKSLYNLIIEARTSSIIFKSFTSVKDEGIKEYFNNSDFNDSIVLGVLPKNSISLKAKLDTQIDESGFLFFVMTDKIVVMKIEKDGDTIRYSFNGYINTNKNANVKQITKKIVSFSNTSNNELVKNDTTFNNMFINQRKNGNIFKKFFDTHYQDIKSLLYIKSNNKKEDLKADIEKPINVVVDNNTKKDMNIIYDSYEKIVKWVDDRFDIDEIVKEINKQVEDKGYDIIFEVEKNSTDDRKPYDFFKKKKDFNAGLSRLILRTVTLRHNELFINIRTSLDMSWLDREGINNNSHRSIAYLRTKFEIGTDGIKSVDSIDNDIDIDTNYTDGTILNDSKIDLSKFIKFTVKYVIERYTKLNRKKELQSNKKDNKISASSSNNNIKKFFASQNVNETVYNKLLIFKEEYIKEYEKYLNKLLDFETKTYENGIKYDKLSFSNIYNRKMTDIYKEIGIYSKKSYYLVYIYSCLKQKEQIDTEFFYRDLKTKLNGDLRNPDDVFSTSYSPLNRDMVIKVDDERVNILSLFIDYEDGKYVVKKNITLDTLKPFEEEIKNELKNYIYLSTRGDIDIANQFKEDENTAREIVNTWADNEVANVIIKVKNAGRGDIEDISDIKVKGGKLNALFNCVEGNVNVLTFPAGGYIQRPHYRTKTTALKN